MVSRADKGGRTTCHGSTAIPQVVVQLRQLPTEVGPTETIPSKMKIGDLREDLPSGGTRERSAGLCNLSLLGRTVRALPSIRPTRDLGEQLSLIHISEPTRRTPIS